MNRTLCSSASLFVVAFAATLISCGGGGGSSSPVSNVSPGGIYIGTIFLNGFQRTDPIIGVVTEAGDGKFLDTYNGAAYAMQFTVTGTSAAGMFMGNVSGSGNGISGAFPNGTTIDSGTQQSSIVEGSSIEGTYATPTDRGSFTLTNQLSLYRLGSSLSAIVGTYRNGTVSFKRSPYLGTNNGMSFDIRSDASFVLTGPCVFAGPVSIIDVRYNAYTVAGSANCGDGTVAGGFIGLGYYTPPSGPDPAKFTFITPTGTVNYFAGVASM